MKMPEKVKRLKFKCPKCSSNRLEEVMGNCTVSSAIKEICSDGDIEYGDQSTEYGEVDRYQCLECGFVLKDENGNKIDGVEKLVEWLNNNCSQE